MHVNLYERISKTVWHVIQCQTEIRQTTTYNFLDIPSMKKKDDHHKDDFLTCLDKEKGLNIERIGVKLTSYEVHYGLNRGI